MPLVFAVVVIVVISLYLFPLLTSLITALLLRKTAKLDEIESFCIGVSFYLLLGVFFGIATVTNYDLAGWAAILSFLGMFLGWPLAFDFMDFNQPDHANTLKIGIFIVAFIIAQMLAVIYVLKNAKRRTDRLE